MHSVGARHHGVSGQFVYHGDVSIGDVLLETTINNMIMFLARR
jgi:hypothetical protein